MLLHAGADREDVDVEDDVARSEADLLGEQAIGVRQISTLRSAVTAWPCLVERHDDDGGPVALDEPGLFEELLLALLEADRVDDALALDALAAPPR